MYLGVDIGSASSKAVVLSDCRQVAGRAVVSSGTGTQGPGEAVRGALRQAGVRRKDIEYCVVTGYGRMTYDLADRQITEISCHARGAGFLRPRTRTVIDIGGQDAKVIRLAPSGAVENFIMNEKCAAGTGRFLEVMARVLNCGMDGFADLAAASRREVSISSVCTVFAESEVISQLAAGESTADVAMGVCASVAERIGSLCGRIGMTSEVVMSGGVALNRSVVNAIARETGHEIISLEHPQLVGALGAALFAEEFHRDVKKAEDRERSTAEDED